MPMPGILGPGRRAMTEDWVAAWYREQIEWRLLFLWWPQRCDISGRLMWLETAYRGAYNNHSGPTNIAVLGPPVHVVKYHSTVEHLIWLLKK
jgi:hypothetical protein